MAGKKRPPRVVGSPEFSVAYEAGRDGFWLARWLRGRGIECHVIHPTSVPVSREHRRAKSDRLDLGLLLRCEKRHCSMVAVPTREAEDGKRPLRERERLSATPPAWSTASLVNRIKGLLALHGIAGFNIRGTREGGGVRAKLSIAKSIATTRKMGFASEAAQECAASSAVRASRCAPAAPGGSSA